MPAATADAAVNPARNAGRVGAVRYLNSRPLVEGLTGRNFGGGPVVLDHPSALADGLRAGRFDAALVPSVAALGTAGVTILPDACVAARGPVRSVKVYFRRPPGDVRSLALDAGSRTSAALARLLLAERFGVTPRLEPLPVAPAVSPDAAATSLAKTNADAALLIGDRAMHDPPGQFAAVWDLGEEWNDWTGLPFVFAVWAGRAGLPSRRASALAGRFSASRDLGVARIDLIAADAGPALGLAPADAVDYLRRNLHFTLGPRERAGLRSFAELCGRAGLLPTGGLPPFADRAETQAPPPVLTAARPPRPTIAAPPEVAGVL